MTCGVVNARFVKPLDEALLKRQIAEGSRIVTIEDHVLAGGFGSTVLELLEREGLGMPVERIGWPDVFVGHGTSTADLRAKHGLDFDSVLERLRVVLRTATGTVSEFMSNE